jgi:hypothetical protein
MENRHEGHENDRSRAVAGPLLREGRPGDAQCWLALVAGRAVCDRTPGGPVLPPADGLFVPVAQLEYEGAYDTETSERRAEAFVGVTVPAAERLLSALDAPCNVTVDEDAGVAAGGQEFSRQIRTERDVEAAVVEAVGVIEAGAARLSPDAADLDRVIAALLDELEEDGTPYKHPAILAVAGRTSEARRALRRYRGEIGTPRFDEYCESLDAMIRAGVPVPPPSEHAFPDTPAVVSTDIRWGWNDFKPGHRLKVAGLMLRLAARRMNHPVDGGERGNDAP